MYGLISKMLTTPRDRDAVLDILRGSIRHMPGCLSYIVATDLDNAEAIWVTEVWDNIDSHRASLLIPSVQEAVAKARPMIAGFGERFETTPVGGIGID